MERRTFDIEEMNLNDSKILKNSFEKLEKPHEFKRFDYYLIDRWNGNGKVSYPKLESRDIDKLRKKSYDNFIDKVKNDNVADIRTIRRWFGINGFIQPKREVFFKMAFALGLSVKATEDYMINGLMIPSFQINDYQEIIYLYGLHNNMTYDYCRDMIGVFEEKMGCDIEYEQKSHTERLWKEYEQSKDVAPESFLKWMLHNKKMFKGYSRTVLDYFIMLKEEICRNIQREEKEYLDELLNEYGYNKWIMNKEDNDDIKKKREAFIRHLSRSRKNKVNKAIIDSMRKAYNIVYGDASDSGFIREIYPAKGIDSDKIYKEKISELKNNGISYMSNKYLSQILGIAVQKADYMRMRNIRSQLLTLEKESICPENIYENNIQLMNIHKDMTVKELLAMTDEYLLNQAQRCQLIGREDILPMIHYIAQKRYAAMLREDKRVYNMREARNFFRNVADAILSKCGMAVISDKYRSDYYMLASFAKEDMYSLADMLEISVRI